MILLEQYSFLEDQKHSRTSFIGKTCMGVNLWDCTKVEKSVVDLTTKVNSGGEEKGLSTYVPTPKYNGGHRIGGLPPLAPYDKWS